VKQTAGDLIVSVLSYHESLIPSKATAARWITWRTDRDKLVEARSRSGGAVKEHAHRRWTLGLRQLAKKLEDEAA